ncbi:MAG: hypothetical protein COB67_00350 [SAR324 cluster bacterium]|uniref:Uncharacterized protein n=1 Tax=SAR324 cluster bacterium TaxID=2024889 RepID=A0A2A4TCA4_9DELT|nr:MAG: hypothetical protein COB67_00350 [SAR324 cluster bacterium]
MTYKGLLLESLYSRSGTFQSLEYEGNGFFSNIGTTSLSACVESMNAVNGTFVNQNSAVGDVNFAISLYGIAKKDLPLKNNIAATECKPGETENVDGTCSPSDPCSGADFIQWADDAGTTKAQCGIVSSPTWGDICPISTTGTTIEDCKYAATNCRTDYTINANGTCDLTQPLCIVKIPFNDIGIKKVTGTSLKSVFRNNMNKVECTQRAECIDFNVVGFASYGNPSTAQTCSLEQGSSDYVASINETGIIYDYTIYTPPSPPQVAPPYSVQQIVKEEVVDIDGATDMVGIDFYLNGKFGYYTSDYSQPYKSDKVYINGVDVTDGLGWPTVTETLTYFLKGNERIWRSKTAANVPMSTKDAYTVGLGPTGGVGTVVLVAGLIWNSDIEIYRTYFSWELSKKPPLRYVENIYGYDLRHHQLDGNIKLLSLTDFNTGKVNDDKTAINSTLKALYEKKYQLFTEMGISNPTSLAVPHESGIQGSVDKCKWYEYGCEKDNGGADFNNNSEPAKTTTSYYIGATNRFVIVVPYKGAYKVRALDATDKIISDVNITESDFQERPSGVMYAPVQFSRDMDIAPSLIEPENACLSHPLVEWGGGVSGVYYEDQSLTDQEMICSKSVDTYVQNLSARKIKILDLSSNKSVEFTLKGPLPYPNQVYLVSLGEEESREYRCFSKFPNCTDGEYEDNE